MSFLGSVVGGHGYFTMWPSPPAPFPAASWPMFCFCSAAAGPEHRAVLGDLQCLSGSSELARNLLPRGTHYKGRSGHVPCLPCLGDASVHKSLKEKIVVQGHNFPGMVSGICNYLQCWFISHTQLKISWRNWMKISTEWLTSACLKCCVRTATVLLNKNSHHSWVT